MSYLRALARSETLTASFMVRTRFAGSIFQDDNRNAIGASIFMIESDLFFSTKTI